MGPAVAKQFRTVAIIGLGLIGSSIARALGASDPGVHLKAYDFAIEVRQQARRLNVVHQVAESADDAVSGADLVILCVPVRAMEAVAQSLSRSIGKDAIVTDVGSSKSLVSSVLRRILPGARIVPGHPVAGSERSGPEAGSAELFEGRWCILTPDRHTDPDDVEAIASFWRSLGAKVEIMSAQQHDLVLAAISHVPHLLASSSVAAVAALEEKHGQPFLEFSAGGFHDFTRIAAANASVWKDIFLSNKEAIVQVCSLFRNMAERLEQLITDEDEATLLQELEQARQVRLNLNVNS